MNYNNYNGQYICSLKSILKMDLIDKSITIWKGMKTI